MSLLFQYVDERPENLFVFSGLEKPSSQGNRLITGLVVSCGFLLCDVPRPTRPLFCADIAASSGRALPFLPTLSHTVRNHPFHREGVTASPCPPIYSALSS